MLYNRDEVKNRQGPVLVWRSLGPEDSRNVIRSNVKASLEYTFEKSNILHYTFLKFVVNCKMRDLNCGRKV